MASPKLDTDNKALLRRISDLELAIKSGSITVSAKAEAPKAEEKPQAAAAAPVTSEENPPYDDVPPPDDGPATTATPTPSGDECVPFTEWVQVLAELKELNGGIWGILLGSEAYIRSDFVLINCDNPTFPMFIKQGSASKDVKEAIFRTTGRKYRLGIFKSSSGAPTSQGNSQKAKDPLSDLISSARDMGVNVTVE